MTEKIRIRRGYAGPEGQQIHFRTAGHGPPLVLFHQSPRSSAEYTALVERWAQDFTVIAPDTPGYGGSDPLADAESANMPDFAAAMVGFLDAIGLGRTAVYGFHTGASLAVALSGLAPDSVEVAVANGFSAMEATERNDILANYLPPFEPLWDGSHLAYLWARIREQVVFFPWYNARNEARLRFPMYSPEKLNDQVMDMLWAGGNYHHAYRAAFAFDKAVALSQMAGPLTIMAALPDPLASHLDRLAALPEGCTIERPANPEAALIRAKEILAATDLPAFEPAPQTVQAANGTVRGYCDTENGQIHYRRAGKAGAQVVVLLHDILSASRTLEAEIFALSGDYDVIAFDLPGHGLSDPLQGGVEFTPDVAAERLTAALDELRVESAAILSFGHAATIASSLASRLGDRVAGLVLADASFPAEGYRREYQAKFLPDLGPTSHGGHLLAGWQFARTQALLWPWFREDIPGIRPVDDGLSPVNIHNRFVALWECQARHSAISADFFAPPNTRAHWVQANWAADMDGMAQPWCQPGATALPYPGGNSSARLAALVSAVRAAT